MKNVPKVVEVIFSPLPPPPVTSTSLCTCILRIQCLNFAYNKGGGQKFPATLIQVVEKPPPPLSANSEQIFEIRVFNM